MVQLSPDDSALQPVVHSLFVLPPAAMRYPQCASVDWFPSAAMALTDNFHISPDIPYAHDPPNKKISDDSGTYAAEALQ